MPDHIQSIIDHLNRQPQRKTVSVQESDLILNIIDQLHRQREKGIAKYKIPVIPSEHGAEFWLQNLKEECIDAAVYAEAAKITVQGLRSKIIELEDRVEGLKDGIRTALQWMVDGPKAELNQLVEGQV